MVQANDTPRRSQTPAIVMTVFVGAIATAVAYLGTRRTAEVPLSPTVENAATTLTAPTIALPHDQPELPTGPHQRTFATSCTICHSTRMVMTQPPFPREQWAEVVHKMKKTYGAPISADAEVQIVDYLTAVRGR